MITLAPQSLTSALSPIGETMIGLQGKKYRVVSNGENKAMPRPPLVKVSSIPWLDPTVKKYKTYSHHLFENSFQSLKNVTTTKKLNTKAKKIE